MEIILKTQKNNAINGSQIIEPIHNNMRLRSKANIYLQGIANKTWNTSNIKPIDYDYRVVNEEKIIVNYDYVKLGTVIQQMRKFFKLSQKEVADLTHLSVSYISQIERNYWTPTPYCIIRIISAILFVPADMMVDDNIDTLQNMVDEMIQYVVAISKSGDEHLIAYARDTLNLISSRFVKNNTTTLKDDKNWDKIEGGL